jgi:threonine dehydratase
MITLEHIRAAHQTIEGRVHRTPTVHSATLSERFGAPVWLKLENWQKTGSFKPRGVLNKIASLTAAERERGLVAASAGNHAQAVAWAARAAGLRCTVVMPDTAPAAKFEATRGYGGSIITEPTTITLFERAASLIEEHGYTFISPFDDAQVVAGAGTVGLEILADLPDAATVLVPVGGGGLLAGVAVAIKEQRPDVRVVGVEPEGACAMWRSLRSGKPERLQQVQTIADGLSAPFTGTVPFEIVRHRADDLVLVNDRAIRDAMLLLLERCKILVEPGGAAGVAALLSGSIVLDHDAPVVAIISGGNIDAARLAQLTTQHME